MGGPIALRFAPDGSRITYLHGEDQGLQRVLWVWDPRSGERAVAVRAPGGGVQEGQLSVEEQLRRERLRERGLGISRYAWSANGHTLMVPIKGDVWVQPGLDGTLSRVAEDVQHPRLSPDGSQLAFVRDAEIHVVPVGGGTPRQITTGARGTGRTHGLPEYIAQEEMSRHDGFWWSPDGRTIAFTEVDETHIPIWRITHQGKAEPTWEDHRYPFPGAHNARVSLWVVPADGSGPARKLELDPGVPWEYLARVRWLPDGTLLAAVQDRRQTRLDVLRIHPDSGASQVLVTERSDVWVNLDDLWRPLAEGGFLWGSERTGFRHLYRIARDGTAVALTSGEWMVDSVVGLSEDRGVVYVLATEADPRERHLYAVQLDGSGWTRLTHDPGMHTVVMNRNATRYVDSWSSVDHPQRIVVREVEGEEEATELSMAPDPRVAELGLAPPELFSFEQRDGVTLHGALYRPAGAGPWPLVVQVYGGPHAQRVQNHWGLTANMKAQYLRSRGLAVMMLDNRGAARRGLAFEGALRWDMGHRELLDQADAVAHLAAEGVADAGRVGIVGWSYGGYLASMAVARFPDLFHVAVAGAPVTHWDSYDTHYTERYMGLPAENPEGYEVSSVMHHVDGLRGQLMLVHGMLDENVHFRHSARLIDALVKAGKDVALQIYPNERHAPRDPAGRTYVAERELGFLERHLTG